MQFRSLIAAVLVACSLSFTTACAKTPPNLTPQAQAAFKADQVLVRVGELQDTAIALNKTTPPTLNDHDAVLGVRFTVLALKTIHDTPSGWRVTVLNAYDTLKQNLPPPTKAQLQSTFDLLDALFAALR